MSAQEDRIPVTLERQRGYVQAGVSSLQPYDTTPDPLPGYPDVMTLGQVAEALQVSLTAARAWCREGKIPGFKMGAVWRVPKAHLIGMMGGRHD